MQDWSKAMWRNRNKLFGLLAVLAIVLAAVWFYGGDRLAPESKPKLEAAQQASLAVEPGTGQQESPGSANAGEGSSADSPAPAGADAGEPGAAVGTEEPGTAEGAEELGTAAGGESGPLSAVSGQEESASSLPARNTEAKPLSDTGDGDASGSAAALGAGGKDQGSSIHASQPGPLPEAGGPRPQQAGSGDSKAGTAAEAQTPSESGPASAGSASAGPASTPGAAIKPGKEQGRVAEAEADSDFVTLTIVGAPDIGTIMETTKVDIGDSKTVLDVLKKAARSQKMQMEYTGTGATAYVQGIDNLYEFDKGSGSGWMYSVNGKFPNRSAGIWPLSPGDDIRWLYTEDLGKDLGAGAEDGLWDGKS